MERGILPARHVIDGDVWGVTMGDAGQDERTLKLLEIEYGELQDSLERFDSQRFKVKQWAITVVGALLAVGVNQRDWRYQALALVPAALFAFLDLLYWVLTLGVIRRVRADEELLEAWRKIGAFPDDVQPPYEFGQGRAFAQPLRMRDVVRGHSGSLPPHTLTFYVGLGVTTLAATALSTWS